MQRSLVAVVLAASVMVVRGASADSSSLPSAPPPEALQGGRPTDRAVSRGASAAAPAQQESDPLEGLNRKMFWFNDQVDNYVLEPAAKGWNFVFPGKVQTAFSHFFDNLRFPIYTVNDLLQTKWEYAGKQVGRFVVNTTIGIAGFMDPATGFGLEAHPEDFGQTLGYWGAGQGPYLVLPLLGPATIRDGAGMLVDYPLSITPFFVDWYYLMAARVVDVVNTRAIYLDPIRQAKESSFDYYTFVRNAYLQRREALVQDMATPSAESTEDLYHPAD